MSTSFDPSSNQSMHPIQSDEDEEEADLEEVEIPSAADSAAQTPTALTLGSTSDLLQTPDRLIGEGLDLDEEEEGQGENEQDGVIRLEIGGETPEEKEKRISLALRKKPMTSKDRAIRLEAHKMHVISLLAHARIRNRWCSNPLLQARLLSLLPHPLQAAFVIPPKRFPDKAQRSRLFLDALQSLVMWWSESFFDISDNTLGLRTRTWDEIQEIVDQLPKLTKADFIGNSVIRPRVSLEKEKKGKNKHKGKGKGKGATEEDDWFLDLSDEMGGEKLRTVNSLMKKALQQEGSRDVSAQLFVSLARACGLGVRLVTSLQALPWRAEKVVQKKKSGAGSGGRTLASRQGIGEATEGDSDEEDEMEEVPIPGLDGSSRGGTPKSSTRGAGTRRLKDPADLYRLRKVKPTPQKLGSSKPKPKKKEDLSTQPPVFWAEVFSRSDQRWIPVDPVRGIIRKKAHFEPTSDSGPVRMVYVVAFEEDGYARDVTLRYTKNFGAKTSKLRVPLQKDDSDWWMDVTGFLQRPYRLNRDDLEDAELEMSQVTEGMPVHMGGFKDHPLYVLERHLKREEVIIPKREIGRFRGEPVYRRSNVISCKTAENWMRVGRQIKPRQEPLKWVKQRAVTIQKRRAQELAIQEGREPIQQALYAEYQTELYRPPPIKDGIIPQNSFGNIDLYAPTMLPQGAVHLPYRGIAKVAKQLGISYAEACTGFEFKKQRALPVIKGIVVAQEEEERVMEAYWKSEAAAEERERTRREERALKRWAKLVNGLRVRQRLQAEYGTGKELHEQQYNPLAEEADSLGTSTFGPSGARTAASVIADANQKSKDAWQERIRSESPSGSLLGGEEDDEKITPLSDIELLKTPPYAVVEAGDKDHLVNKVEPDMELEKDVRSVVPVSELHDQHLLRRGRVRVKAVKAEIEPTIPVETAGGGASSPAVEEEYHIEANPKTKKTRGRKSTRSSKTKEPPPPTTRSLRSRAPKTDEQRKEEEAKWQRVKDALVSDEDE